VFGCQPVGRFAQMQILHLIGSHGSGLI